MHNRSHDYYPLLELTRWVKKMSAINLASALLLITDTAARPDTDLSRLIHAMLKAIGLPAEQVNLLCGTAMDDPALTRAIKDAQPKLLFIAGEQSAQRLLKKNLPLQTLREQAHVVGDQATPALVTCDPAYLLTHPQEKKRVFIELQHLRVCLENAVKE